MVRFTPQFNDSSAPKNNDSTPPLLEAGGNPLPSENSSGDINSEAIARPRRRQQPIPQLVKALRGGFRNTVRTTGNILGFRFLKGRWRWYVLSTVLLSTGGVAAAGYWAWLEVESSLPNVQLRERVMNYVRSGAVTMKAADGHIIHQSGPVTHDRVTMKQVPPRLAQAFIAIEDRRFQAHDGVDYQGIFRAVLSNLESGRVVEGGSTITQQLARIIFLNQERTYWRKLRESRLAQKIEEQTSKDDILQQYLNLVYLGSGSYGVADAAWVYFSKPIQHLTLAEMATIAGLAPAPTEYSPLVNPDLARRRRNLVLQRMLASGYITAAEAAESIASPLETNPSPHRAIDREASYFVEYIKTELPKHVTPETLANEGLIIETTLNRTWQQAAEKVIQNTVAEDGQYDGFSQAALVAIDPRSGEIRVMVGGTDFQTQKFNRATQAQRQPGSTFKGLLYTAAIASGFSPEKSYLDAALAIGDYKPKNYGGTFRGNVSMRDALTSSLNIVAIKVLLDVGWNPVITLAKKMGIDSELKPTYSLALGASEVNLLELTGAYGTIANKGTHTSSYGIKRIIDQTGKIIYEARPQKIEAVDPDTAAIMTWMLRAVVDSGTGGAAYLPDRPVAGKTGTSDESRDLWFIGYVPQLVAGVWMGNDDNTPTWGMSSAAARAWGQFMTTVIKDFKPEEFPPLPSFDREATIKVEPIRPSNLVNSGGGGDRNSEARERDSWNDTGRGDSSARRREPEPVNDYAPPASSRSSGGGEYQPVPEARAPEPIAPEPIAPAPEPIAPAPESIAPAPEPIAPALEPVAPSP